MGRSSFGGSPDPRQSVEALDDFIADFRRQSMDEQFKDQMVQDDQFKERMIDEQFKERMMDEQFKDLVISGKGIRETIEIERLSTSSSASFKSEEKRKDASSKSEEKKKDD